jgi:hypothetical protein
MPLVYAGAGLCCSVSLLLLLMSRVSFLHTIARTSSGLRVHAGFHPVLDISLVLCVVWTCRYWEAFSSAKRQADRLSDCLGVRALVEEGLGCRASGHRTA